jgi:Zn-dependent peptidase ImmA (M78 family)/DNA-binding XRE family transcriptional regulator
MTTTFENELLKIARNYLGLNQKEFAEKVQVSQSVISNIEKCVKPLTEDIVEKLKAEFGETFFKQKVKDPQLKVFYRASSTVAKKYTDPFESRLQIIANNISRLLERVDIPENNVPFKDLEDFELDAEYLANEVREYFGLGVKPIDNMVKLLERNGVIVHFFDYGFISAQNKNFDGVSFYAEGVPVILINSKIQNARKVFTLAHELCHLICHNHPAFFISKDRDIEREANKFASEFIAPKKIIRSDLIRLDFDKLFQLKAYWKLSVGALLFKAKETTLTPDQYKRWVMAMAPYRKNEPHDILIEKPILLEKMFQVCEDDLEFDENFNDILGLSPSMFDEIYWNKNPETIRRKLKIVI